MISIYKAEQSVPGLAEKIKVNCSVAYTSKLQPSNMDELNRMVLTRATANYLGRAGIHDVDLYITKSILVTTNWNKNDDIFTKAHVWNARYTPIHKPTNIGHDEKQGVGHITDTWAITEAGVLIPDDTVIDDLPDVYHLVNAAVIYRSWQDASYLDRTNKLIADIEAGIMFVSMECLFSDFDYGILTPDGQSHILARGEDTAFLTKHLKAYSGTGLYNDHKIGRVIKNPVFSGKGYVYTPANEESIIFTSAQSFNFSSASRENPFHTRNASSGVLISYADTLSANQNPNKEIENTMSETLDFYKEQNSELKTSLAKLEEKFSILTEQSTKDGISALEAKITDLESKLGEANTAVAETKTQSETLASEIEALKVQLAEANTAKASLEEKIAVSEAEVAKATRVSILVDGGVSKEVAIQKVERYISMSDELFADIAKDIVEAAKKDDKEKTEESDKKKKDESAQSSVNAEEDNAASNVDDTTLDNAQASENDTAMNVGAENEDEMSQTRAELQKLMASRLGLNEVVTDSKSSK